MYIASLNDISEVTTRVTPDIADASAAARLSSVIKGLEARMPAAIIAAKKACAFRTATGTRAAGAGALPVPAPAAAT
eukprot:333144-Pleurochrysis_carterae.AAC.1